MDEPLLQRIDMKIAFPKILALIACVLLTACGAGNNCVGHNGCSDTASSTTTTTTTTTSSTTYTIGGTISGLTSGSLILQNNSGNALTISANSTTFVFTTALASGVTYAVTVGTQPSGLTCSVTNGTGTIASANVTNVAVTCATTSSGITYSGNTGTVSILAGSISAEGFLDGTGTAALFKGPNSMAVDSSGNIYLADQLNRRIRKITSAGVVTTFAGSGTSGFVDGTGTAAQFLSPYGMAIDSSNNLYVRDTNTVRKITPAGVVTTFAGSATTSGTTNGTGTAARFTGQAGIVADSSGNLYTIDGGQCTIRKITSGAVVTTLAGQAGVCASTDGTGTAATFLNPSYLAIDSSNNLYVTEPYKVRKISPAGVVTTFAGSGSSAYADGTGTAASFLGLVGITVDSSNNLYVLDTSGLTIRRITSAGVVTTFAGIPNTSGTTNGTLTTTTFSGLQGITIDSSGNLYVTESVRFDNNTIRKIVFTP